MVALHVKVNNPQVVALVSLRVLGRPIAVVLSQRGILDPYIYWYTAFHCGKLESSHLAPYV